MLPAWVAKAAADTVMAFDKGIGATRWAVSEREGLRTKYDGSFLSNPTD